MSPLPSLSPWRLCLGWPSVGCLRPRPLHQEAFPDLSWASSSLSLGRPLGTLYVIFWSDYGLQGAVSACGRGASQSQRVPRLPPHTGARSGCSKPAGPEQASVSSGLALCCHPPRAVGEDGHCSWRRCPFLYSSNFMQVPQKGRLSVPFRIFGGEMSMTSTSLYLEPSICTARWHVVHSLCCAPITPSIFRAVSSSQTKTWSP